MAKAVGQHASHPALTERSARDLFGVQRADVLATMNEVDVARQSSRLMGLVRKPAGCDEVRSRPSRATHAVLMNSSLGLIRTNRHRYICVNRHRLNMNAVDTYLSEASAFVRRDSAFATRVVLMRPLSLTTCAAQGTIVCLRMWRASVGPDSGEHGHVPHPRSRLG